MTDLSYSNNISNLDFIEYQELDRKRIASELHDTSLQNLTHIIHQIELASLYIDEDSIKAKLELEDVSNQLRQITKDIRNTIFDLRPMSFDDLGLRETIEQYIFFIKRKYEIIIHAEIDEFEFLDEKFKLIIYRIIQECLMNSAKHADAHEIYLLLKNSNNQISIIVSDDGVGIESTLSEETDYSKNHYGLTIVKDRVSHLKGSFSLTSSVDEGTKIEIQIPYE